MELLGFSLAILAGFSLGIMGSGGSILTVPILVYIMGVDVDSATAFSLFIVGISSLIGSTQQMFNKQVDLKTAALFGIPSLIMVFTTRYTILHQIPKDLFGINNGKDFILMLFFAALMILSALSMLRKTPVCAENQEIRGVNYGATIFLGLVEGTISGLVGAGGGFLIIPILVQICKMDIKKAIGTSLLIVGVKSLVGFIGHLETGAAINWRLVLIFVACTVIGIFLGIASSTKFSTKKLKTTFAYFVIVMAIIIVSKELIKMS